MKKATNSPPQTDTLSLSELSVFCHAKADLVVALVEYGVVTPVEPADPDWHFAPRSIARTRKAARLMRDLGLNLAGVALVLDLIEERDRLARRLAMLDVEGYA